MDSETIEKKRQKDAKSISEKFKRSARIQADGGDAYKAAFHLLNHFCHDKFHLEDAFGKRTNNYVNLQEPCTTHQFSALKLTYDLDCLKADFCPKMILNLIFNLACTRYLS